MKFMHMWIFYNYWHQHQVNDLSSIMCIRPVDGLYELGLSILTVILHTKYKDIWQFCTELIWGIYYVFIIHSFNILGPGDIKIKNTRKFKNNLLLRVANVKPYDWHYTNYLIGGKKLFKHLIKISFWSRTYFKFPWQIC